MKIEVNNASFYYKKEKNIINDFSFTFESGKLYFIKGQNGSGKTTLSKLICGLLRPQQGNIIIDDKDIKDKRTAEIAKDIGYLFQNTDMQLFAPTVWEELSFIYDINNNLTPENKERIKKILRKFQLENLKDSFPLTLSGGEKQRLALATIFIRDVKFLILDEPFSAIDEDGRHFLENLIKNFIKQGGGAIVINHGELLSHMQAETISLGAEYEA